MCGSIYTQISFTKYILQYYTTCGCLNPRMWTHRYQGLSNCTWIFNCTEGRHPQPSCCSRANCILVRYAFYNIDFIYFFIFWPLCVAWRILVPRPETEPRHTAVKAPSPNHWTAREFPTRLILMSLIRQFRWSVFFSFLGSLCLARNLSISSKLSNFLA